MIFHRKIASQEVRQLNTTIIKSFLDKHDHDDVRKTHLFGGRYENIYLTTQDIPQLRTVIDEAINLAEAILNEKNIRAGFWFNYMPPGSSTLIHCHDDNDELLSAVYYLYVPEDSGNLIIHETADNNADETINIKPNDGEFIFFKPEIRHEVTANNSSTHRLSIGINFGPAS